MCRNYRLIDTPIKNRENRNYPFSLHEVLYIQRRGVLSYVALFKAVVPVKIEHASAVVSAHGGEVAVLEDERRAVLNAYAGVAAAFYGCPKLCQRSLMKCGQ